MIIFVLLPTNHDNDNVLEDMIEDNEDTYSITLFFSKMVGGIYEYYSLFLVLHTSRLLDTMNRVHRHVYSFPLF